MSDDLKITPYPEWWNKGKLGRPEQLREFIHDLLCERDRLRAYLSVARSPRDLEAAVEAGAKAVFDGNRAFSEPIRWDDLPEITEPFGLSKEASRRSVRLVLEAALPHLGLADGPEPEGLSEEEVDALVFLLDKIEIKGPSGMEAAWPAFKSGRAKLSKVLGPSSPPTEGK